MRGFDPDFEDLPDYILKITARIWEGRRPDLIRRYYAPDCVVRAPAGDMRGAEAVVANTLETMHEFPDRRLLGEDVVWAGDDDAGYYSSHRILSTMRHDGDGRFGPATGKPVRARTIADCVVRENRIHAEWMVRDRAAMARRIGLCPRELAARLGPCPQPEPPAPERWRGIVDKSECATGYADCWRCAWNEKRLSAVAETYHEAAALALPGGASAVGRAGIDRFLLGYLAAFPDAEFAVDHLIVRRDPDQPARIAMRWSVAATHGGRGAFGEPAGKAVRFFGINHAHAVGGRIVAEWILIDELAVWQQILHGDAPEA